MRQTPEPSGSIETTGGRTTRPSGAGQLRGGSRMRASHVWRGMRAVLLVLEAVVAALKEDEAFAVVARVLVAAGEMIVEAGKHKRS